jgi:hypothetical protein
MNGAVAESFMELAARRHEPLSELEQKLVTELWLHPDKPMLLEEKKTRKEPPSLARRRKAPA